MVSELHDGKGTFKLHFIALSYAVAPLTLALAALTALTHFLTLNEGFLANILFLSGYGGAGLLAALAIREIHEYEFKQIVSNVLLSLFLMIVILFGCSVIWMFWDKAIDMASEIFSEVKYHAFG
jgi:hypothetical protein